MREVPGSGGAPEGISPTSFGGGRSLGATPNKVMTSICGDGGYMMRLLVATVRSVWPVWLTVACVFSLMAPALALAADQPGEPRNRLTAADNRRAKSAVVRRSDLLPSYRVDTTGLSLPGNSALRHLPRRQVADHGHGGPRGRASRTTRA